MVVEQSKIEEKVLIYKKLFKSLLKKCKIAKSKIDVFHCTLYKINSVIQLTVILFSATSTFLQALMPGNRNGDIIISNSTDLVSEETLEDENYINGLEAYGWGLGFRTLLDPSKQNNLGSIGEFGWAGAASTYFLVDNIKNLNATIMTQVLFGNPDFHRSFYKFIYSNF